MVRNDDEMLAQEIMAPLLNRFDDGNQSLE